MTKTRPSTDCGSDHQLLVAKLNIKFRQKKGRSVPVRYDRDNTSILQGRSENQVFGLG